jgi:hypothetical protein
MRALFWIFPSILSVGKKGEMIRATKAELGAIARKVWQDAQLVDTHSTDKTLMALMRKLLPSLHPHRSLMACAVKADASSDQQMHEDEIVSQMRTVLSAAVSFPRSLSRCVYLHFIAV